MTVAELRGALERFPDDAEVILEDFEDDDRSWELTRVEMSAEGLVLLW